MCPYGILFFYTYIQYHGHILHHTQNISTMDRGCITDIDDIWTRPVWVTDSVLAGLCTNTDQDSRLVSLCHYTVDLGRA